MSTSNLAAAALALLMDDGDCLAAAAALHGAAAAAALHDGVVGGFTTDLTACTAARHGDARGRSDLLDDVVDVAQSRFFCATEKVESHSGNEEQPFVLAQSGGFFEAVVDADDKVVRAVVIGIALDPATTLLEQLSVVESTFL